MSKMMKAVKSVVGQPLVLHEIERPAPGPQQILIRVAAAGVNRPDLIQRAGRYPPPPGAPETMGLEVSGTVEAVGGEVTKWKPGDRVCALLPGGGYAEYALAHEGSAMPIPEPLSFVEAAGLPETVLTVWNNVFEMGRLKSGETLLIHGGASGIGTTAIQLAAARGARVFATAGSDERCRVCETLGAVRAFNYRTTDFVAALADATGGRGVDLILDIVGGTYTPRNLAALAVEGRLVQIGLMDGTPRAEVDLRRLLGRRLTMTGSTLRPRSVEEKGRLAATLRREVWPLVESGAVRPVIHRTFPLADAAAAHALMESGAHVGKIVLTMPD
jgi:putative PIG3 family NAD(P)H quinone oxidoreductase